MKTDHTCEHAVTLRFDKRLYELNLIFYINYATEQNCVRNSVCDCTYLKLLIFYTSALIHNLFGLLLFGFS